MFKNWFRCKTCTEVAGRLTLLEQRVNGLECFNIYKEMPNHTWHHLHTIPSRKIAVKDVILRILTKLNMKMTYVDGSSASIEIKDV